MHLSDERGDGDLPEDFLRLQPPSSFPPFFRNLLQPRLGPFAPLSKASAGPLRNARVKSRGPASGPAVVPRVDSNSISPTQRGEERTLPRRVLHAAYQSSVINLETNCRSPRRPIAERCNGPAMKGVDGTARRRRGEERGEQCSERTAKQTTIIII